MGEIQSIENDLTNFVQNIENDVDVVFKDIVTGASYAEQILSHVLDYAIPVTDAVVSVIAPQDIVYVNIITQVLGDIKAIAENLSSLSAQAAQAIQPGENVSVELAAALAKSAETTYTATLASINNITNQLIPIVKGAVVTVKKSS